MNTKYLAIRAHYFLFLSAMGPVLPFLPLFGKRMGISELVMGTANATLPVFYLLAKPLFGFLIDYFRKQRKLLFIFILVATGVSYLSLVFIPDNAYNEQMPHSPVPSCNVNETATWVNCSMTCYDNETTVTVGWIDQKTYCFLETESIEDNFSKPQSHCSLFCHFHPHNLYYSYNFWLFIVFMILGTIGYNVSNSVSDAICFDVLGGNDLKYGQQRVWGTIGFGLSALVCGYFMNSISSDITHLRAKDLNIAFIVAFGWLICDAVCCGAFLKLPVIPRSRTLMKDVTTLIVQPHIAIFLLFAVFVGMLDSTVFFYLLWYVEDLGESNNTESIKLLEGLIVAVETLGGELIFFLLSGKVLKKLGFSKTLSLCFFFYGVRLCLFAFVSSPWWIVLVELFLQGPTYALSYATIVAYASAVTPPGSSGTIQGIVAGMDDGAGFCIGNLIGGYLYSQYSGRFMYTAFGIFAFLCCICYTVIYLTVLKNVFKEKKEMDEKQVTYTPADTSEPVDVDT